MNGVQSKCSKWMQPTLQCPLTSLYMSKVTLPTRELLLPQREEYLFIHKDVRKKVILTETLPSLKCKDHSLTLEQYSVFTTSFNKRLMDLWHACSAKLLGPWLEVNYSSAFPGHGTQETELYGINFMSIAHCQLNFSGQVDNCCTTACVCQSMVWIQCKTKFLGVCKELLKWPSYISA